MIKEFPPPTKHQPAVRALDGIDFEMSGQTFVSMVGPSGCGKSTFLNIVSGIETPTSGSVDVTDRRWPRPRSARLRVPGSAPAPVAHRAGQPALRPCPRRPNETRRRASEELRRPGGTPAWVRAHVPRPPVGRHAATRGTARAFSVEPDLLLMDEPFSHLDVDDRSQAAFEELQTSSGSDRRRRSCSSRTTCSRRCSSPLQDHHHRVRCGNFADLPSRPHRIHACRAIRDVATVQANILGLFEDMDSRRASQDPRIAARAEGES